MYYYLRIKFFLQVAKKYPYFAPAALSRSFNATI